jgi:hypothetical protein
MPNRRSHQWKAFDSRRWGYLRVFRRQALNAITRQIQPAISFLKESGVESAQDNIDAFISEQPLTDFYVRLYRTVGGEFGQDQFQALDGKMLKEDDPVWVRMVQEWVDTGMAERLSAVTSTSRKQIKEVLNRGVQEGWGIDRIASEMQRSAGGLVRATRIARTEIIASSNIGSFMGAKATQLPLKNSWLSTSDGRTRDDHAEADGQTVAMDDLFNVGGDQLLVPGDWQHGASAGMIINCRCTETFEVDR